MNQIVCFYGQNTTYIDVTNKFLEFFTTEKSDSFFISKETVFNTLFSDVYPGIAKKLTIQYANQCFSLPESRISDCTIFISDMTIRWHLCIGLFIHCFNDELWDELQCCISSISQTVTECCVVVTVPPEKLTTFENHQSNLVRKFANLHMKILPCANKGMDVGGFFVACEYMLDNVSGWPEPELLFKVHSKTHTELRQFLLRELCSNVTALNNTISTFSEENVGIVSPEIIEAKDDSFIVTQNIVHLRDLCLLAKIELPKVIKFPRATIFCVKWSIMKMLFLKIGPPRILLRLLNDVSTIDINWYQMYKMPSEITDKSDSNARAYITLFSPTIGNVLALPADVYARDGMMEHAFERFFGVFVEAMQYKVARC